MIPVLFIHGKNDDFVKPNHSKKLFKAYAGDKSLILIDGNHNSYRRKNVLTLATIFMYK